MIYNDKVNSSSLATVATSGKYSDLSDTPSLATVATSGKYSDLSDTPTIPTVNNAKLTIQKNGTDVKSFTANASSDVTCNITVPTNNNQLTNGAGYITSSGQCNNYGGRIADFGTTNTADTWVPVMASDNKMQHREIPADYNNAPSTLSVNYANSANYANSSGTASSVSTGDTTITSGNIKTNHNGGYMNVCLSGQFQIRNYSDSGWAPIGASAFNINSSKRYKENIKDLSDDRAKTILQLRAVTFDYINKNDAQDCIGFIAEEVEEIEKYPCFYKTDESGELIVDGLDYSKFVPQIIKMIQIQQKEIDELKERISALEK